jgi:retron-type reverse transcriptase
LERIRQVASRDKKLRFTGLWHHVYQVDCLRKAYCSLKRGAAPGVDGETWRHYVENLEENLQDLSGRLKHGAYRAKPVKRAYIPNADGRQRPLGGTVLEDKVVQRAMAEVMNAIYEGNFLGFSYGFRPGRSPHGDLDALYAGIMTKPVSWVLDADIRSYFGCPGPRMAGKVRRKPDRGQAGDMPYQEVAQGRRAGIWDEDAE